MAPAPSGPLSSTLTPARVGSGAVAAAASSTIGATTSVPCEEGRSGLDGAGGHETVEVVARDGVAVAREVGMLGPLHLDGVAEAVRTEAGVTVRARQRALETHVGQLSHRPGREPVAAGLLPRELLLLHDHHVPPGVGQPEAARCPRRPCADDHHVVHVLCRRSASRRGRGGPAGRPGRRLLGRRLLGAAFLGSAFLVAAFLGAAFSAPLAGAADLAAAPALPACFLTGAFAPLLPFAALFGAPGRGVSSGAVTMGIVRPPPGPLTSVADVPGEGVPW